jgi:diaminohydroxyphosphoribosylaminopyrimidine deaminase/5-amino-6-(5-phosphoribosylamino)uracil reductase
MVAGSGIARLRAAGINVVHGLLESDCISINRPFIKQMTTGLPYVTLKSAMTLDGKTGTASGDSCWVTGESARRMVHRLRGKNDAIMVGAGTVIADDPQLTCRVRGGHDPLRVVVDSTLRIPVTAQLLHLSSKASTLIATISEESGKIAALKASGAEILQCNAVDGRVDLQDLMQRLGRRGVQSMLLEGGAELAGAMLRGQLIDRCIFFYAPKLVGGDGFGLFSGTGVDTMADAIRLSKVCVGKVGDDIYIEGEPAY